MPEQWDFLEYDEHVAKLQSSAVDEEVARARGYKSVGFEELRGRGFTAQQAGTSALLIPLHDANGTQVNAQMRRDAPRLGRDGKERKYELPARSSPVLDVHPFSTDKIHDPSTTVVICESPIKADACRSLGYCAVGLQGVWGWVAANHLGGRTEPLIDFREIPWKGRSIVIVFDSDMFDKPEVALAAYELRRLLAKKGGDVKIVAPPAGPKGEKVGIDDFLNQCSPADRAATLARLLDGRDASVRVRQVMDKGWGDICLWVAKREFDFYSTSEGICASVHRGANVIMAVGAGEFTDRLSASIFDLAKEVPSNLKPTCATLRGQVLAAQPVPIDVPIRVGRHEGDVIIDLGRSDGQVVRISEEGWRCEERSPIPFRRSAKMGELPTPGRQDELAPGDGLTAIKSVMNVRNEDWPVLLGAMVAMFFPDIDHPVLLFTGPQGAGKTGIMEAVTSITDPLLGPDGHSFGVTSIPDPKDWPAAASSSWCLPLDNVSALEPEMSDLLCRAVTGDGIARRKLYTDNDLIYVRFRRCILLASITLDGVRPDLAERMVRLECEMLDESRRMPDSAIGDLINSARPAAFADLLDLVVDVRRGLARLPESCDLPRLADFGRILKAVDVLTEFEAFTRYIEMVGDGLADSVADDPVAEAIAALVAEGSWCGTADELLNRIRPADFFGGARGFPDSAKAMGHWIARNEKALREMGIEHERPRRTGKGRDHILRYVGVGDVVGDVSSASEQRTSSRTACSGGIS
jgi:hypothetical protein